jgi:predicted metalloprotease with PDZ domain
MPGALRLAAIGAVLVSVLSAAAQSQPTITYGIRIDPAKPSSIEVSMAIDNAPSSVRLAMAVHPEYNDRFWRYVRDVRASALGVPLNVQREAENSWKVSTFRGRAEVHYRIALPAADPGNRPVWHTFADQHGASINGTDTFMYLPDFPNTPTRVTTEMMNWNVVAASSVSSFVNGPRQTQSFAFPDLPTLLDSPMLMGALRSWTFDINGVRHRIVYQPLPTAVVFDTAQFVDAIQRVAREAVGVFRTVPYRDYTFLLEDGAWGALEHANSVTIGMPSRDLAADPRAYLGELAHEFFHTWNLMRLYPEGRGKLSDRDPAQSTGLWFSEGVTMFYAEALTRRAGFPERNLARKDLLAEEIESYFGNPGNTRISPELASARAVDTTGINGDYDPNYYTQGRLIGTVLDIIIRDSTAGRRGLDDLMRAMYARYAMKRGFTTRDVERTASEVCSCSLHRFFEDHVRGTHPLDFNRYLGSVGLRVLLDTVPAADSAGTRFPDLRMWAYAPPAGGKMRVMIQDPSSIWARAGLHTGTELVAFNGAPIDSFPDFRRAFRSVKIGDLVPVEVVQGGVRRKISVKVTGYSRVGARVVNVPAANNNQCIKRELWFSARADWPPLAGASCAPERH